MSLDRKSEPREGRIYVLQLVKLGIAGPRWVRIHGFKGGRTEEEDLEKIIEGLSAARATFVVGQLYTPPEIPQYD